MKALIIDDEAGGRETLKYMVEEFTTGVKVVGMADSVKQGIEMINEHSPEIVFLDIEMPTGSGFSLFDTFPEPDFFVIFATAYDHYAIRAFRFAALDYLLKPIDPEDLEVAIKKAKKHFEKGRLEDQIKVLMDTIKQPAEIAKGPSKLVLAGQTHSEIVSVENILYFEGAGSYSEVKLKDSAAFTTSRGIRHYEDLLVGSQFFRIHKSFLVNLLEVSQILKTGVTEVVMSNGDRLEVSRRKTNDLMDALEAL